MSNHNIKVADVHVLQLRYNIEHITLIMEHLKNFLDSSTIHGFKRNDIIYFYGPNILHQSSTIGSKFLAFGGKEICLFDIELVPKESEPHFGTIVSSVISNFQCKDWIMDVK